MTQSDLIQLVDRLEDATDGYVLLSEVENAFGEPLDAYIAGALLLVDYRTQLDGSPVTVCRLNRRHPLVQKLTSW